MYFVDSKKVKRGHYNITLHQICNDASAVDDNYITDKFVALLQNAINEQPFNWLWSHRRWKQQMKETDKIRTIKNAL